MYIFFKFISLSNVVSFPPGERSSATLLLQPVVQGPVWHELSDNAGVVELITVGEDRNDVLTSHLVQEQDLLKALLDDLLDLFIFFNVEVPSDPLDGHLLVPPVALEDLAVASVADVVCSVPVIGCLR